ncbi:MAG: sugar-binding domain-containing protein [Alkalispirochaeta sp.]
MNTDEIAQAMKVSRAKVSRLLNYARDEGIVEIRVVDRRDAADPLVADLTTRYRSLTNLHIVNVTQDCSAAECLNRVTQAAAAYLADNVFSNNQIVGVAAGETVSLTARNLKRRGYRGIRVVQLQGNTVAGPTGIGYIAGILQPFGDILDAELLLFPVPFVFFDTETRRRMWDEPSIRLAREYQQKADVYIFSVGIGHLTWERTLIHAGLDDNVERRVLLDHSIVGDLAGVFFRSDGSYNDLSVNERASGPPLEFYRQVKHSVCIASGSDKVPALHAVLEAGYVSDLVIDRHTASLLRGFQP